MKMGEKGSMDIESVSTGALSLDIALGIGGLPRGPRHRDLRPGVLGQVHPRHARRGQRAARGRRLRLHRRRARGRPEHARQAGRDTD